MFRSISLVDRLAVLDGKKKIRNNILNMPSDLSELNFLIFA